MTSLPGDCRSCGTRLTEQVLDLGDQPAADYFPGPDDPPTDPTWPLSLWLCTSCHLAQLNHIDGLLPEPPLAVESATSKRLAGESAEAIVKQTGLRPGDPVIEIASHHGGHWLPRLLETGLRAAEPGERAALVVDVHGIAHEEDIDGCLAAHAARLAPDGFLVMEFHHLLPLVLEGQFDTVRHGHPVYLSVLALAPALARHGLTVTSVVRSPAYGGSLQLTARPAAAAGIPDLSVAEVLADEELAGLDDPERMRALQRRASLTAASLHAYLHKAQNEGRKVLGYGAPSKAPVLLAWSEVGPDLLEFTVDMSPGKQGRRLPGSAVPIKAPADLLAARPDEVLVLTWDIADEIAAQLPEVREWGGRFVVPVPEPHVLP